MNWRRPTCRPRAQRAKHARKATGQDVARGLYDRAGPVRNSAGDEVRLVQHRIREQIVARDTLRVTIRYRR